MDNLNKDNHIEELHNKKHIKWTKEHEDILIDWGDKAMCFRWLHSKSNEYFTFQNTIYTIPVIIMSTITGTANFAQNQFPSSIRSYIPMVIGSINIFAGIISTIQQFLKITELNEAHRVSSIAWDKFYRKIRIELSKAPIERQNVTDFIKLCAEEYDRLIETSPIIKQQIVDNFLEVFEGKIEKRNFCNLCFSDICQRFLYTKDNQIKRKELLDNRYRLFKEIKKPVICNTMESLANNVYKLPINKDIHKKNYTLIDVVKEKEDVNNKEKIILNFKEQFKKEFHREPTDDEIMDNLINEEKNMSMDKIKDFIHKYKIKKNSNEQNIHNNGEDDNNENIEINIIKNESNETLGFL